MSKNYNCYRPPLFPKMFSKTMSENSEARTTPQLEPIVGAAMIAKDRNDIALVEAEPGKAYVMCVSVDEYVVAYMGAAPDVWHLDGEPVTARVPLLAWRKHDGAWRVIDSRVSSLLPKVDDQVEGA